jgi:hypothetical protein
MILYTGTHRLKARLPEADLQRPRFIALLVGSVTSCHIPAERVLLRGAGADRVIPSPHQ